MDTLKIKSSSTKIIAHRGLSGIEAENTCSAFIAAANRSYFGIETDVHKTADDEFIIIHDDNTERVSNKKLTVEESDFETLRNIPLFDKNGLDFRKDLLMPTIEEYFSICKKYNKTAVFELKNKMEKSDIKKIIKKIDDMNYLENTVFISFCLENLIYVKEEYPNQKAQYLVCDIDIDSLVDTLKKYSLDLDAYYGNLTQEIIDELHKNNIKVNAWTVDNKDDAEKLIDMGIDYITTNILE